MSKIEVYERRQFSVQMYTVHVSIALVACENIRFSLLFAAGDVSHETCPAAKSKEKRMFSQAIALVP